MLPVMPVWPPWPRLPVWGTGPVWGAPSVASCAPPSVFCTGAAQPARPTSAAPPSKARRESAGVRFIARYPFRMRPWFVYFAALAAVKWQYACPKELFVAAVLGAEDILLYLNGRE